MDVHPAANEEDAVRLVSEGSVSPKLIIADYNLQTRTGLDVITAIRGVAGGETPAIVVTADAEPKVVGGIRAAGVPVLIKPVSPPRLRVMMHNLLFEPGHLNQMEP